MQVAKKDVQQVAGALYVCAGPDVGGKITIHRMYDLFQQDEVEVVLLINVENLFNAFNRKAMLHNISIMPHHLSI